MRVLLGALAAFLFASAWTSKPEPVRPAAAPPMPTEPFIAGPEELDWFWRLIEASADHSSELEEREEWLLRELKSKSVKEIVVFEETRARVKARADTWLMWQACEVIQGWSSDDVFWYFQDWLISLGRDVYEQVTASPDALADVPRVRALADPDGEEIPEWETLSDIAEQALEHKTGKDGMEAMTELVGFEIPVNPDPAGETPAEDKDRFPALRAIFGHEDRLLG